MTQPLDHIAAMSPYKLADLCPPDGLPLISLSQNESLRPPSPLAVQAGIAALEAGALYPDPDWTALRTALAQLHDIPSEHILCGNGSLDLIGGLARVYAGPGRAVLAPAHAYPFFRSAALMADARFDTAPEDQATVSVNALIATVRPDTALVCVANPGNPTGTRIAISELRRLRDALADHILLVIDEAYGEFADHPNERCFDMVQTGNTVVLRTLSKAYGMAGFRVGWGLFPPQIAQHLRKVMNPNNVAAPSQAAATAALQDHAYMRETCALTAQIRDDAARQIRAMGLHVYPSFTNFVLIDFQSPERATAVDQQLQAQGIFLRGQAGAGLPQCLRMTIGPAHQVEAAMHALERLNHKDLP